MDDDIVRAGRARQGHPFLSTGQAAFYLGLSLRTLQTLRSSGAGPAFRRHGRHVLYHIEDLESWSRARREGPHGA
jgi:excisionase family DNA binding protein